MSDTRGLSLLSGGLDSMLAVCLLRDQGIAMEGIVFVSPFFDAAPARQAARQLGVTLHEVDFSADILALVRHPPHGFGGAMNPCIDCHAAMIRRAGAFMRAGGYAFVSTGEVLNQRPMSQNRKSLATVAEASGLAGRLLRPLSARLLDPTEPELEGRVDRERLGAIQGRQRTEQLALAKRFGLTQFPSPAGGCLLTEKGYCRKLRDLFDHTPGIPAVEDVALLRFSRHFRLPEGGRIIVGRNRADNQALKALARQGRAILHTVNVPGPTAVILGDIPPGDLHRAAQIVAAYGDRGALAQVIVRHVTPTAATELPVTPLPRETFAPWML